MRVNMELKRDPHLGLGGDEREHKIHYLVHLVIGSDIT